jgi:hypothetical protein
METKLRSAIALRRRTFSLPVSRHRAARSEVGYRRKNLGDVPCKMLLRLRLPDLPPGSAEATTEDTLEDPEDPDPPINHG